MNNSGWLKKASIAGASEAKALIQKAVLQEYAIAIDADLYAGTEEELAALLIWQHSSTTKSTFDVSPTGAAVLPKSILEHDDLPRVPGWEKILQKIAAANGDASHHTKVFFRRVHRLLYDVEFWHHQSTNGRWNDTVNRWERYGVKSVDGWRQHCPKTTFHRIKNRLIELGLIDARSYLWHGRTHLWIRPTDELSRILFEPGYWDQVQTKYASAKPKKTQSPSTHKPRGISARHAELDKELRVLYSKVINYEFLCLSIEEKWEVWRQLTDPIWLSDKYEKAPFATVGSYRYGRINSALFA